MDQFEAQTLSDRQQALVQAAHAQRPSADADLQGLHGNFPRKGSGHQCSELAALYPETDAISIMAPTAIPTLRRVRAPRPAPSCPESWRPPKACGHRRRV